MSCVYFAAILEAKKILPTLYYGPQAGLGQKICCSLAERAGPGSFMLAPGGPGCKSAGPCHLYTELLLYFFIISNLFLPLPIAGTICASWNLKLWCYVPAGAAPLWSMGDCTISPQFLWLHICIFYVY